MHYILLQVCLLPGPYSPPFSLRRNSRMGWLGKGGQSEAPRRRGMQPAVAGLHQQKTLV